MPDSRLPFVGENGTGADLTADWLTTIEGAGYVERELECYPVRSTTGC